MTTTFQRGRRSVDERREELIDATLRILATEGLPAATTRRITEEAGLALGAFHYAFRSKDELLRAVIERYTAKVAGSIEGIDGVPRTDLPSAVEGVVRGLWSYAETYPDELLAQYELVVHALRDPELRDLASYQYDALQRLVVEALDGVPGAPAGSDLEELARFLVATIDGLILCHCIQGDLEAARRRLEVCVASARDADWSAMARQAAAGA
jgi:AcrR family transcriptional regulator